MAGPVAARRPRRLRDGETVRAIRWPRRPQCRGDRQIDGWTDNQVISVCSTLPPAAQAEALIHEVLHCADWHLSHEALDRAARALVHVLSQNPQIVRWLADVLQGSDP